MTKNLKTIESISLRLEMQGKLKDTYITKRLKDSMAKGEIEIRGEVYMT